MDRTDPQVQTELRKRIEEIRTVEAADPSRRALSRRDLAVYVGTSLLIALLGVLVMAL